MSLPRRYWEDLRSGDGGESPAITPTREDIISFAIDYDPQPFHLDEEAAKQSLFGGLAASGWHTASLTFALLREHALPGVAWVNNLGFNDLRWKRPVKPDIPLRVRYSWGEMLPETGNPGTGQATLDVQVLEGDGEVAMEMSLLIEVERRPLEG
ncbi:MAG: hypothetical protein JJU06_00815 [Ectothiorhodospiraceae bacterium]|nr:hypothetical protein [Ectothiorhodospiraceae bacterium]MCH8506303.1 hypothetical protein [Ectothiorhodospiraceae bacterium]